MIVKHIHHALEQVRELRYRVIERQQFKGYSGRARMASGVVALAGAGLLQSSWVPNTPRAAIAVWGSVCAIALLLNYGALLYWFVSNADVNRDVRKLRPTLEVFPPLIAGACLSLALLQRGDLDLLFGMWMTLFGVANLASRHVLPQPIAAVGLFYLVSGITCLFCPGIRFTNPWPMGIVFFVGEVVGGLILHLDPTRRLE